METRAGETEHPPGDRTAALVAERFPQAAEDKPSPESGDRNGEENTSQMEGKK
jgi:hypothetical protein